MLAYCGTTNIRDSIQPQTIPLRINHGEELALEVFEARYLQLTLKHRLLDPLTRTFTDLGNPPQSTPASGCFCAHVITNDHQHIDTLPNKKWQISGDQPRLVTV
jgi:hypothetical protein